MLSTPTAEAPNLHDVKIPKLGMSTVEVDLVSWLVGVGDEVAKGAALAEVESEKAVVTIEAEVAGTVAEILVPAGQTTAAGVTIARIRETG